MLTVRYDRLGLQPGELLLDLGCGFGRHAYEAARRERRVVAVDYADELKEVRNTFGAMVEDGQVGAESLAGAVQGDATQLPFADATFHRIVASEVLEHIADDVAAVGELARAAPRRRAGSDRAGVAARAHLLGLAEDYHAVRARRPCAHLQGGRTAAEAPRRGSAPRLRPPRPRSIHRTGGCAARGPQDDGHPLIRAYRRVLEWDIVSAPLTRLADRALNPVLGKSLVVYARKPR